MTNGFSLFREKDGPVRWTLDFTCDLGSHSSYREREREREGERDLNLSLVLALMVGWFTHWLFSSFPPLALKQMSQPMASPVCPVHSLQMGFYIINCIHGKSEVAASLSFITHNLLLMLYLSISVSLSSSLCTESWINSSQSIQVSPELVLPRAKREASPAGTFHWNHHPHHHPWSLAMMALIALSHLTSSSFSPLFLPLLLPFLPFLFTSTFHCHRLLAFLFLFFLTRLSFHV